MFKHILVPTDGSELSSATVARAVTFAREAGAKITFFYAQPDFPMPIYGEGALIEGAEIVYGGRRHLHLAASLIRA